MTLSLSLLGVFQARLAGRPLTEFYSSKVRGLLAYLAVETGREHPRPLLATLLWPDWDDRAALGNLRFSLSKLRQAISDQNADPPFLLIRRDTIQLNPAAGIAVDVHLFQQELRASRWESVDHEGQPLSALRAAAEHLATAMELYRGRFLEGFAVGDSAAFEEWALVQREQLEREARWALHGLTALHARLADFTSAERAVRRLLDMEPWDELGNRRLMALLAQRGQRNAALRHYAAYHDEMARELGCEPEEETQALYAQIRDKRFQMPRPSPTYVPAWPGRASSVAPGQAPSEDLLTLLGKDLAQAPPTAGSGPLSRFAGRELELARLGSLLDGALTGKGGVALIAGEAGGGKTALLDEFARQAGQAYRDLIVLRGSCNAHAGAGDPYLPFREILQTLAGDVEGKRASGTLSLDQARRVWEALPAVGAALVEHGPDLIDRFVPGEALLRRVEGFPTLSLAKGSGPPGTARWLPQLREISRRAGEVAASSAGPGTLAPLPDLFAQVTQVLHAVSVGRPLLLAIDDLQWADGGTAALLFHLGRRLAGSRILLVCAYRPEALDPQTEPEAGVGTVLRELTRVWGDILVDLNQSDGWAFIEAFVDSEPNCLGVAFRQALYDHTAGNPLFTAELLRSFEREGTLVQDESGRWVEAAGLDWERCPPQAEAVIARHLAGLREEDRALLQAASVQGERFVAEVAARALGWDEAAAVQRLSGALRTRHRLVEAVSLEELAWIGQHPSARSGQRLSHYRFRHSLVQGSAYRSLDAVARPRLHGATGRALEAIYAPATGEAPELAPELAQHFEAAGMYLEAARYRLEAGRWAERLVAHDEAIANLEQGLELVKGVASSRDRLRLELGLHLALVIPAALSQGWQAPVLRQALGRLADLTQYPDLQDDPQRPAALTVLALASTWSANPERAQRFGEELMALAQDGDQQSLMLAHWVLGHSQWAQGRLVTAREFLNQALAFHDPGAGRSLGLLFGEEPSVTLHATLGFVLWLLGYPDQGRSSLQRALASVQEIERPSSTAFAHLVAGLVQLALGRDMAAALSHAQALQPLGKAGLVYGTWAELLAGQAATAGPEPGFDRNLSLGLAHAAEADSALQAIGSGVGQASQLLVQAQMLMGAGQAGMAMEAMDRAKAWIEHTGVRVMEAEVWRMRGELLLADRPEGSARRGRPEDDEVEACYHRALDIARGQQARWLELRATASLARLWQAQGRQDEARELLSDIYDWFTEGFDTVDLGEAKALLDELA